MTREELRNYVDEQRSLNMIPYHVYSTLIDGIDTLEQEPTTKIEESNFSQEQYLADLQSAYDCGKSVLDKIRAEVENINVWGMRYNPDTDKDRKPQIVQKVKEHVIEILDKYKSESEET